MNFNKFPIISTNFLISIFFISLSLLFIHPFEGGGDFYHHVNTGKEIIETGKFPFTDIYTHTAQGQPWIAYAWGSGIILYLVFSWFGPVGISLLVWLIGTLTILLLYYLLRSLKVSQSISLLAVLFAIGPILTRFPNRPEIFTYPLILLLLLVDGYRTKFPKLNLFFPLIILIWANLYGSSVPAGLGLILLLAARQLIADKFKITPSQRLFYSLMLTSLPLALLNPNTYKTVLYMFLYIPKVSEYEGEWAGIWTILKYTSEGHILLFQYIFLVYFVFLVFTFTILLFSFKKILKNKLYLILSLSILVPFFAYRHLPLAAILSSPLIGILLTEAKNKFLNGVILTGSIAMVFIMLWLKPIGMYIDTQPSDQLINFLKENKITGKTFNHNTTGSFLSYHLSPDVKVFFDTRDDLFKNNEVLTDLYNTQMNSQSILPLLKKYNIDLVVADFFSDGLNFRELFNTPSWSIVYFNDRYFVAIPTSAAQTKGYIKILSAIDPFSPTASKPGLEAEAEAFYRGISPTSSNQLLLAQTLLAQNKSQPAIDTLLAIQAPQDPTSALFRKQRNYFLMKAYSQLNDCQNFKYYLEEHQNSLNGNFIFDPSRKLPSIDDDLKALYYKKCENDLIKAGQYMKSYLNRPDVNPKEKIKFQQLYNNSR